MFEKEAEKYASDLELIYKKGVLDGYNKANEEYEIRMKELSKNRDELLAEIERLEERVGELSECY